MVPRGPAESRWALLPTPSGPAETLPLFFQVAAVGGDGQGRKPLVVVGGWGPAAVVLWVLGGMGKSGRSPFKNVSNTIGSGVTQDIPEPGELTFAGDLTPNEIVGTRDIPGLGELTSANNGITPNESGGSQVISEIADLTYIRNGKNLMRQETIFGTDNLGNRVMEKVSLRTTQFESTIGRSTDRSHEETRCDPQPTNESAVTNAGTNRTANEDPTPNNPSKTYARHTGSTTHTHDVVDEMQPDMVEDGCYFAFVCNVSTLMISLIDDEFVHNAKRDGVKNGFNLARSSCEEMLSV
ncbi:hypothetical protein C2845_PM03G10530 [Panicum miliaceum]|uniref:Uncharacterized protein n=1 Tax=Panicum miliaceum TaxID=4540 RepID=A0A3L6TB92_PANMI|nr:hypothetical protein C2845_PM03G10530 [Panicum miliaceum]